MLHIFYVFQLPAVYLKPDSAAVTRMHMKHMDLVYFFAYRARKMTFHVQRNRLFPRFLTHSWQQDEILSTFLTNS